jgi:hypothetical protein
VADFFPLKDKPFFGCLNSIASRPSSQFSTPVCVLLFASLLSRVISFFSQTNRIFVRFTWDTIAAVKLMPIHLSERFSPAFTRQWTFLPKNSVVAVYEGNCAPSQLSSLFVGFRIASFLPPSTS